MIRAPFIVTTLLFGMAPVVVSAQTAPAPAVTTAPDAAATQTVTPPVREPDTAALNPAAAVGPRINSMPRWSEFPAKPANVPTPADFAARVKTQEANRDLSAAFARTIVWEPFMPEALAAGWRAQIDPQGMAPVDTPLTSDQATQAAQALRQQAAAPPVAE